MNLWRERVTAEVVNVGILGASGYGGGELLRRLLRHPQARVVAVGSRQFAGQRVAECWPQLAGHYQALRFEEAEAVIARCEVLFAATPHGATAPLVAAALAQGKRVVDLSADFRLSREAYQTWYGLEHPHPELIEEAVYGLTELHRQEVARARLVANPGCNATAASLALAPLAAAGLLGEGVTVSILTGVSGAGRSSNVAFTYSDTNENVRPYKVAGTHRHIGEIEATLARVAAMGRQLETQVRASGPTIAFTPHLVPMGRGILATCTAPLAGEWTDERLLALFADYYGEEPLIVVQEALPQTKAVMGSDRAILSVRYDARTRQALAFAAIDNLGKGAAGQALHNFNVMMGFEEFTALELVGVWP
jgi:N-acetyl-gamma-glutamyl-phosphate reductase